MSGFADGNGFFAALKKIDVRIPFAGLLGAYLLLGLGWLGFSRSPWQAGLTVAVAAGADFLCNGILRKKGWRFPWSGMITGLGLALLLNYGSHPWLPVWPALLAILSKYILQIDGHHVFNPGLFGLIAGMALSGGELSPAPAYQWGGSWAMVIVMLALALMIVVPKIKRTPLLLSFLLFYGLQMGLRACVMRYHLPPEMLILGTIGSPAFFLFTFYMLTDPMTSPSSPRAQVLLAFVVTLVDLFFHFKQSYSTLFPALFLIQASIFGWRFVRSCFVKKVERFDWRALGLRTSLGVLLLLPVLAFQKNDEGLGEADFYLKRVANAFPGELGSVLEEVDPRIAGVAKWVLSVGDAVAVADVDGDGLQDVFLTYPLKKEGARGALFLNRGGMKFERFVLPEMAETLKNPGSHGLASCPVFADYDNDGDQDLFLGMGFGESRLYRNELVETGEFSLRDVTAECGLAGGTTCVTAVFFDADRDGDLDLLVGNAMSPRLLKYDKPVEFNPFRLPEPEYVGDRRMFHFMHQSWHKAENGGENVFYRNRGDGTFQRIAGRDLGMPETHWTLALGVADFNEDGWPDVYAASDFGPDDVYLNEGRKTFSRHAGKSFGEVGNDTYKGMNVSVADFDRDGSPDVYVSNVHAPLQAEGSLLWMTGMRDGRLEFRNEVVARGALNANRFGWGAAAGDLDLDGWVDLVQANGMVDDTPDKRFDSPHDYWYVNGQLARTGPEVHAYADQWADMRGYSIWGLQRNRVLMNQGGVFRDAAVSVGLEKKGNARGVALADLDNDGDLEVIITRQFSEAELYENTSEEKRSWIGFELSGAGAVNRDATGAKVILRAAGTEQVAWSQSVSGFSAQSDRRILFGLGEMAAGNVAAEIRWPDGRVESFNSLEKNRYHRIEKR